MPAPATLAPVFSLPHQATASEELRLVSLLTEARTGLSFGALAQAAPDSMATYAALFALLTRGTVVTTELPSGEVGYRRRKPRATRAAAPSTEHQLRFAA